MIRSFSGYRLVASILAVGLCSSLCGCTEKQLQIVAQVVGALDDFTKNKAIVEQSVREVKAVCSAGDNDSACDEARILYEDARDLNDQFISLVAAGAKPSVVRSMHGTQPGAVRDAAVRFLSQSSVIISPGLDTRSIPLERSIIIPPGLPQAARRISPATRALMANSYEKKIRWADWDSIPAASDLKGQKEIQ